MECLNFRFFTREFLSLPKVANEFQFIAPSFVIPFVISHTRVRLWYTDYYPARNIDLGQLYATLNEGLIKRGFKVLFYTSLYATLE